MSNKEFIVRRGLISGTTLVIDSAGNWVGNTISETKGGTNQTSYSTGDILYASGANTLTKLTAGSNTEILTLAGGVPTWAAPAGSGSPTDQLHVVGGDGINVTYGSPDVTIAVDSTVARSGDNVSIFVNDANYISSGSPLQYVQDGDNVSRLVNDAGYITSIGSPGSAANIVGGDGITVTTGSPQYTIAVDSTVARLTGSPTVGSPSQIFQGPQTFLNNVTFETNPTTVDGTGAKRPVGLGVLPPYEIDVSATFDTAHAGMVWHVDAGSPAVTFTAPNDPSIEIGSMWQVQNDDVENITIAAGSPSVVILRLGAGGAPVSGNVLVQQGGIVSIYKYTDTEYWLYGDSEAIGFGSPISADFKGLTDVNITGGAGSPSLPTTGDTLYFDGTYWVNLPRGTSGQVLTMGSPLLPSWATPAAGGSPVDPANIVGGDGIIVTTGSPEYSIAVDSTVARSGDNVSIFTNDAGYLTSIGSPGSAANIVGGDGITVVIGSPQYTIAVDSTVLRTTSSLNDLGDVSFGSPQLTGNTLYFNGTNWTSLAVGSNTEVLTLAGGIPSWAAPAVGTVTSSTGADNRIAVFTTGTNIEGDASFTWDGSSLDVTGDIVATNGVIGHGTASSPGSVGNVAGIDAPSTYGRVFGYDYTGAVFDELRIVGNPVEFYTNTNGAIRVASFTTGGQNIYTGGLYVWDSGITDNVRQHHDGTDYNFVGTTTTDINMTSGITAVNLPAITLTTTLDETYGGTGQTTFTTGDILYASGANVLSKLAVGSNTEVLTLAGGIPSWAAPAAGTNAFGTITGDTGSIPSDKVGDTVQITGGTSITTSVTGSPAVLVITNDAPNVSTTLSVGTVDATTVAITSDGGADDVILPAATVSTAGMLTTAKWGEIVANTAKVTNATHTGQVTGATALALDVTAITAQPASGAIVASDTILTNDGGVLSETTFTQMDTYFNSSLSFASIGGSPTDQLHVVGGDGITVTYGSPDVTVSVDGTVFRTTNTLNDISDVNAGSPTIGAILYNDGSNWLKLPRGTSGQLLTMGSPLLPKWAAAAGAGSPSGATVKTGTADGQIAVWDQTTDQRYEPTANILINDASRKITWTDDWSIEGDGAGVTTMRNGVGTLRMQWTETGGGVCIFAQNTLRITSAANTGGGSVALWGSAGGITDLSTNASQQFAITGSSVVGTLINVPVGISGTDSTTVNGNVHLHTVQASSSSALYMRNVTNRFPLGSYSKVSYRFNNPTTAADPGTTFFRQDNSLFSGTNNLYFADDDYSGNADSGNWFQGLNVGDIISGRHGNNRAFWAIWQVDSVTDNTGWWTVGVTLLDSTGTTYINGTEVQFEYFPAALWAGATNVVGGDGITVTTGSPQVSVAVDSTVVRIGAGSPPTANIGTLRIANSGGTDWADFSHDGTDFNIGFTNTTDLNFTGLSGAAYIDANRILTEADFGSPIIPIIISGAPSNNEIAVWVNSNTIEGSGTLTWDGSTFDNSGTSVLGNTVFIKQTAAAQADVSTYGQLWVNSADDHLYFTNDTGTDYQVSGVSGGSGSPQLWISPFIVRSAGNTDTENRFVRFAHLDGTQRGYVGYRLSETLELRNDIPGEPVSISGRTVGDTQHRTFLQGDADASLILYYPADGVQRLTTETSGQVYLHDDSGLGGSPDLQNRLLRLVHQGGGSVRGTIGHQAATGTRLDFENNIHGGLVHLRGETSGGVARTLLEGNPDGALTLYNDGTATVRTVAATSGGLEVNNTLSGGGFERVLTTGDFGSPISTGTVTASNGANNRLAVFSTATNVEGDPALLWGSPATLTVSGDLKLTANNNTATFATFRMGANTLEIFGSPGNMLWIQTYGVDFITRKGGSFIAYETADINFVEMYHDGTDGVLTADGTSGLSFQADYHAFNGEIRAAASTTSQSSLNIPTGTAPSAPAQGDIWVTATDIFARINGVSQSLLGGGGGSPAGLFNVVEDITPQLGGNLSSNTFDIDMLDNDFINFGTSSDVVVGFTGTTFDIDYLPTGGTWNITGFSTIAAGTADVDFDAITATSYGGITEANLLDKSATETVSGAYTFSGALLKMSTGASHTFQVGDDGSGDSNAIEIGKGFDSASYLRWTRSGVVDYEFEVDSAERMWLHMDQGNVITGQQLRITNNGTGSTIFTLDGDTGNFTAGLGDVSGVTIGGITEANLVDKSATETITGTWILDGAVTTSDFGTGGQVKDGTDVARPIGFNVIPVYEIDAADTFDLAHVGMLWHKDAGGAVTFLADTDATVPQGASYLVHNDDTEDLLIAAGSPITLAFLAPGAAPVVGDITVQQGGIVTVYKYSDTEFWAWGAKAAAASELVTITTDTASSAYKIPFANTTVSTTGSYGLLQDSTATFTYNPSTNTLVAGTFSGSGTSLTGVVLTGSASTKTAGNLIFNDNVLATFGTGSDADFYFSGTDMFIDLVDGADLRVRGGTGGTESMIVATANAGVDLYYNGTVVFSTQVHNSLDDISGAQVLNFDGNLRDVGFAIMEQVTATGAITISETHQHKTVLVTSGTGAIAFVNDTGMAIGAVGWIVNNSASLTLTATAAIRWMDGSGTVKTGNRTLAAAGWCTWWKQADATYYITGVGIT